MGEITNEVLVIQFTRYVRSIYNVYRKLDTSGTEKSWVRRKSAIWITTIWKHDCCKISQTDRRSCNRRLNYNNYCLLYGNQASLYSVCIYIYIYIFKILRGKTFDEFKVASSITNNHKLNFESVYNPIQVNEFLYTILIKIINISTLPRKEWPLLQNLTCLRQVFLLIDVIIWYGNVATRSRLFTVMIRISARGA